MIISGDACYISHSRDQLAIVDSVVELQVMLGDCMISRVLYFNGPNGEDCPGDSSSTLISNKGPSLPEDMDCSTAIPRM